MSLLRQIVVLVSLVLAAVFAGSFAISVYHARSYLDQQLGAHAQDTATLLGLSMGHPLAQVDRGAIESVVGAIGDRGYYRRIAVEGMDGAVLFEREQNVVVEGVPSWFVRWLPLQTPRREAVVMSGWKQSGKVVVSSHPGYAYKQLWEDASGMFWWFIVAWAVTVTLIVALMRFALAPLSAMERQALAICAGEFKLLRNLPWARELRRVAAAMNKMSVKIEESLADKIGIIGRLEREAHLDPLTGLYNRSYLEDHLESLMAAGEVFDTGALLLLRLTGLPRANELHGYATGDALLCQTAILLKKAVAELRYAVAARLNGVELALLVEEIPPEEARAVAERLLDDLRHIRVAGGDVGLEAAHIGIGYRNRAVDNPGKLFAGADMALSAAQSCGNFGCSLYPQTPAEYGQIHGATEWRQILERALRQRNFVLHAQPVMNLATGFPCYREILARIPGRDGNLVTAGIFLPMARRMGLAVEFDYLVVDTALARMDGNGTPFALHISSDAVLDASFPAWLRQTLAARSTQAGRIILQLPEYLVMEFPAEVGEFVAKLKPTGCRFGFSHVSGATPEALSTILQFRPYLIKADANCAWGVESSKDKRVLLEMLRELAHGMDALLVAGAVETASQLTRLRQLGVDAAQGAALAPPQAMEQQR